jgi:hypothetical protein
MPKMGKGPSDRMPRVDWGRGAFPQFDSKVQPTGYQPSFQTRAELEAVSARMGLGVKWYPITSIADFGKYDVIAQG